MKYNEIKTKADQELIHKYLEDFVPEMVFDIHSHLYDPIHFPNEEWGFLDGVGKLGISEMNQKIRSYIPAKNVKGLYFGMPRLSGDREMINDFVSQEVEGFGSDGCRGLVLASPQDSPETIISRLQSGRMCGLKVYHCYADRTDTMNASIPEYAPEWMWEILHEYNGVLMLHIVREEGIADEDNLRQLRRLCRKYPQVKVVLAHIARSFNYRTALQGLHQISDLDNVVVDTSAICESEAFTAALKALGPRRVLWGSDFPVSEMRGRCITTGNHFFWLHPELLESAHVDSANDQMTLVGIESLIALKEACVSQGLNRQDIDDVFYNNAVRFLNQDVKSNDSGLPGTGPAMWQEARKIIAGGTSLMSKQAELYDQSSWPAYFTRSQGCEVWDMDGKRYIDFVGGVGSVLLGYADKDVNNAVLRRINAGSYCSLVNPDEIRLAQKLLDLHPWAKNGKVRFARTGGEAMSVAVRCARAYSGKSGIAFCGYHGWHDWYLAANLNESTALDGHLIPGLAPVGVPRELQGTSVPFLYNDVASFDQAVKKLSKNVAAIVMEPMRAQWPKTEFIDHIVRACRENDLVLIVDEITSGLRYGYPGAHGRINLRPDIVVYAKAMSNGIPFGAVVGNKAVMEKSETSFISSSYWTDGIGTSAALAVLEKAEQINLHERVWNKGLVFQKELQKIAARYEHCRLEVTGMPVTPSLTFNPEEFRPVLKTLYIRKMLEKGFLTSTYFYLMDAHSEAHLAEFYDAFENVLNDMDRLVSEGAIGKLHKLQEGNKEGFTRLA